MQYDSNYLKSKKQISVFVKDTYQVVTKKKKTIETNKWVTDTKFSIDSLWIPSELSWDLRGETGHWESGNVPFIHLGSENLVLCLCPKIEMFSSGPGDENCQKDMAFGKKRKKKEKAPLAQIQQTNKEILSFHL